MATLKAVSLSTSLIERSSAKAMPALAPAPIAVPTGVQAHWKATAIILLNSSALFPMSVNVLLCTAVINVPLGDDWWCHFLLM